MKSTFIGGGAHRLLGILRGAMRDPRVFDGGEICLFDLDSSRACVMAEMLKRTPEYAHLNCRIHVAGSLEEALDGSDAVGVIFQAGSQRSAILGAEVSWRHGFISSDNVSPNGAMHALKAGPTILHIARAMEKLCPDAWLIDFVNPVAVFSGMVNNHTKIKALGVCAGFTNHQWDISRILGTDIQDTTIDVDVAGINHLSFILRGTVQGEDVFKSIDRSIEGEWKMCPLQDRWNGFFQTMIPASVTSLIDVYRNLGVLIFSTEGDGMQHLHYDKAVKEFQAQRQPEVGETLDDQVAAMRKDRQAADAEFAGRLKDIRDSEFWTGADRDGSVFGLIEDDIFIRVLRGIAGVERVKIVTSRPNRGTVVGFDDRTVIEYSQHLDKEGITGVPGLSIPAVCQGLIAGLAAHQTMLGDAIALEDPRLLAHALVAYPWMPYSEASRAMHREMLQVNAPEISAALRSAGKYL